MIVYEGSSEEAQARIRAHAAFDPLWQNGIMKRRDAYRWMSWVMGLPQEEAHISMFNIDQCNRLIEIMEGVWTEHK